MTHGKTFTAEDPALTMNYPGFLFRALQQDGYDAQNLLPGTGLTRERLSDPSFRLCFWQLRRLVKNAEAMTGDPHLGPRLALRFDTNLIGLPYYAAVSAARLGDALLVANRFFFLTFPAIEVGAPAGRHDKAHDTSDDKADDGSEGWVDGGAAEGEATIRLRPKIAFGDIAYFAFASAIIILEGLLKALLRTEQVAVRAEMTAPEPEGWGVFAPELGFPVRFGASEDRLFFPAAALDRPLPGADPINHPRLVALCERLAAEAAYETTMTHQVVAFLEADRNLGAPLAAAAAALGCSERGLRRQLERSGASYRKLVDQTRERRAKELLAASARPIQAIACELGFEATSNFARSFKRWTGVSPKTYRDSIRARGLGGQT